MTARGGLGIAAALLAGAFAACETVDLQSPPADVNACRPGQQFFVDQIWPNVLAQDYGGKHCYDAQCHGGGSNNSLKLTVPTSAGTVPLALEWADNYRAAAEQMNCATVDSSPLLTRPSGIQTHGGGVLISPTGTEADLIKMWVGQP